MSAADGVTVVRVHSDDPAFAKFMTTVDLEQYARSLAASSASSPGSDSHGSFSGLVTHAEAAGVSTEEDA